MISNNSGTRFQSSIRAFFQPGLLNNPLVSVSAEKPEATEENSESSILISETKPKNFPRNGPSSRPSPLPSKAAIIIITQPQIQPLRRINALLLPITYHDSFYHKILTPDPPISFSRVITWSDPEPKVVGGIVCRVEVALRPSCKIELPQEFEEGRQIYIQSLALLSPYRGKGLAAEALRVIIQVAVSHQELKIGSLYAHVWTCNKEALKWYSAQGFKREEPMIHGYYRLLKPDTAWVLRRRLTPTDFLADLSSPITEMKTKNIDSTKSAFKSCTEMPSTCVSTRSFQKKGPGQEWNDLPADSEIKKRSETSEKAKKKRIYPSVAFES